MPLRRYVLLLFLMLVAATGCARGLSVSSPAPAETYSITVRNESGIAMIVRYNDTRGDAILGSIAPGGSERFVIAAPASMTITVRGDAVSGDRRSGPHAVTLVAGSAQVVTLR